MRVYGTQAQLLRKSALAIVMLLRYGVNTHDFKVLGRQIFMALQIICSKRILIPPVLIPTLLRN